MFFCNYIIIKNKSHGILKRLMCVCVSITSSQNFRVQLMIFICNFCFIPLIWSEQIDFTFHWFGLCWISICNSIELDAKCKIQYIMDCTWFENTYYQTDEWPAKVGTQVFDSLVFFLKFFCSYNCNDYYTLLLLKLKKIIKIMWNSTQKMTSCLWGNKKMSCCLFV